MDALETPEVKGLTWKGVEIDTMEREDLLVVITEMYKALNQAFLARSMLHDQVTRLKEASSGERKPGDIYVPH